MLLRRGTIPFLVFLLASPAARSTAAAPAGREPFHAGLLCLDEKTGGTIWEAFPAEIQSHQQDLRLCTDGKKLVVGGDKPLVTLDLATGEPAKPTKPDARAAALECNDEKIEPEKLPGGMTVAFKQGRSGFSLLDPDGYVVYNEKSRDRWPTKVQVGAGRVIVSYPGVVSVLDPEKRETLWTYPPDAPAEGEGAFTRWISEITPGPSFIYGVSRGTTRSPEETPSETVVALDPDHGWPIWQTAISPRDLTTRQKLTVAGDSLLVSGGLAILALDSRTGAVRWRAPPARTARQEPPLIHGRRVVFQVRGALLPGLLEALDDEANAVFAGEALHSFGGGAFLPVLKEMAGTGPRAHRKEFEKLVASLPKTSSLERLFAFLVRHYDGSSPARKKLVLATIGAAFTGEIVFPSGRDSEPLPGTLACGDPEAVRELASRLGGQSAEAGFLATSFLPSLPRVMAVVLEGLCDPDRDVRFTAVESFPYLRPDAAFLKPILVGLLGGSSEAEARTIVERLMMGRGGMKDLEWLLDNPALAKHEAVFEELKKAIEEERVAEEEKAERPRGPPDATRGPLSQQDLPALLALPPKDRVPLMMEVVSRRGDQDRGILKGIVADLAQVAGDEAIPVFEELLEDTKLVDENEEPWFDLESGKIVERHRPRYWAAATAAEFLKKHGREVPDRPEPPVRDEPYSLPSNPEELRDLGMRLLDQFETAKAIDVEGAEKIAGEAIRAIERGAEEESGDRLHQELLAMAYSQVGDHGKAAEALEQVLGDKGHEATGLRTRLAVEYAYLGDDEKALAALKAQAADRFGDPDDDKVAEVGLVQLTSGRTREAAETMQWSVKENPGNSQSWVTLAIARQMSGDAAGAEASARSAEVLGPPEWGPGAGTYYYNLACYHALAGDTRKAVALFGKVPDHGFVPTSHVENDHDLDSLRGDPAFEETLAKLRQAEEGLDKYLR